MSTTIDRKVVEMQFDNSDFERNAKKSMSTLDKLKEKLDFKAVAAGLLSLGTASSQLDFHNTIEGLTQVGLKFDWMYIIGKRVLERLTDQAMHLTKSLTLDQVTSGWSKYEEKTTAVQTIMSATGRSIEEVNEQLEALNWFTDETSYNFTDMVSNIGKFTSAGIQLESAVTAMQGIATWAAISGAGTAAASRAMYNLSQSMGIGSVQLIDWKSIENANMGTKAFKEQVLETAEALGRLVEVGEDADGVMQYLVKGTDKTVSFKNFRENLSEGWFDNEVLENVLNEYGAYANMVKIVQDSLRSSTANQAMREIDRVFNQNDYSGTAADFESIADSLGISATEAEALYISYNSVGREAFIAAQQAKTFHEAIEATKDAVSSSFMNIFETIFGDYQDAKLLWTDLANEMWEVFAGPLSEIGSLLQESLYHRDTWKDMLNTLEQSGHSAEEFEEAMLKVRKGLSITYGTVEDEEGNIVNLEYSLEELIEKFGSLERVSEKGLISNEMLSQTFEELGLSAEEASVYLDKFGEVTTSGYRVRLLESVVNLYNKLKELLEPISEAWAEVFPPATVDTVRNLIDRLHRFSSELEISSKTIENIKNIAKGVFSLLKGYLTIISTGAKLIGKVARPVIEYLLDILGSLGKAISDTIENSDLTPIVDFLTTLIDYVIPSSEGVKRISDAITDLFSAIRGGSTSETEKKFNLIESLFVLLIKIGEKIKEVAKSIWGSIQEIFGALTLQDVGNLINTGLMGGLLANLIKWVKELTKSGKEKSGISKLLEDISNTLEAIQEKVKAPKIKEFAISIAILAASLWVLSTIDSSKILVSVAALGALAQGLAHAMKSFDSMKFSSDMSKKFAGLIGFATSLLILSFALKVIGNMDVTSILKGLGGLFVIMTMVSGASESIKGVNSKGLIKMALSMVLFAATIKILGSMDLTSIGKGLLALGGILLELAVFMQFAKGLNMRGPSAGIATLATSMLIFAIAMKVFATMSLDQIGNGLMVVGSSLLIFAMAAYAMKGSLAGAFAVLVMANALLVLAPAMFILSRLDWEDIGKGLVAIAGALAIMAIAVYALKGHEVTLLAIGAAFALIGIGTVALAAGIIALTTAISVGASEIAAALVVIITSIASLLPMIIQQIHLTIVSLVNLIAGSATEIVKAVVKIIDAVLDGIKDVVPRLVDTIFTVVVAILLGIDENIMVIVMYLADIVIKAVKALINYVGPIVDVLFELIVEVINSLADAIENYGQPLLDAIGRLLGSIWNFIVLTLQNLISMVPVYGEKWASYLDAIKVDTARNLDPDSAMEAGRSFASAMGDGLTEGIEEQKPSVIETVKSIGKEIEENFDIRSGFTTAASDGAEGFANALYNKTYLVTRAARNMGNAAIRELRNTLDEHSPSKVFAEIGDFATQGFVQGITNSLGSVSKATTEMGDRSIAGMNSAISRIGDAISNDSFQNQPVIRPVLDLSDVNSGANQMRNILGDDYNLALSGSVTSRRLSNSIEIQNGGNTIANAVASLKEDLNNMTQEIMGMKIVMDSGALVGSIAPNMDKALGTISTYKGRGNTY